MPVIGTPIIADGRTGANRNRLALGALLNAIIADGRTGANRNIEGNRGETGFIIADGRTGANRNPRQAVPR